MQVTNMSVDASACNHLTVRGTIAGEERVIRIHRDELSLEPDEVRTAFLMRLRSWALENSYTTANQIRNNIGGGKVFHL